MLPAPTTLPTARPRVKSRAYELRKHVGAVHAKAPLSLLQRKVANVLLLNAFEELPDERVVHHSIALRDLARVCGFDSNNWEYLQDALRALTDVKIEWNVIDDVGKNVWGRSAYLAEVEMVERSGMATYAYPPKLRRELANPDVYARINLAIQARFGSGYSLALYENCVRYYKLGTTGWHPLSFWRDVLGVEDNQYVEYKYLNKQVLKRAIDEVNRCSDIRITMETKRRARKVVALRFDIKLLPEDEVVDLDPEVGPMIRDAIGALPDPKALAPEPAEVLGDHPLAHLQHRLLSFGLTAAQALDLSTEFPEEHVRENLDHVAAMNAQGKVKNVAAYTVAAIRGNYAASAERAAAATTSSRSSGRAASATRKAEAAEAEARRAALDHAWGQLSPEERVALTDRAVARLAAEVPKIAAMYEEEVAEGNDDPEAMRPMVRSTIHAFRLEEMERLL